MYSMYIHIHIYYIYMYMYSCTPICIGGVQLGIFLVLRFLMFSTV